MLSLTIKESLLLAQMWLMDCPFLISGEITLSMCFISASEYEMPVLLSDRTARYSLSASIGL